jgi:arabinosyltransferase C
MRAFLIGLGTVPFALWFVYVLKNDPVFQARAATLTYSPNFRQIFAGYVLLIIPALYALFDKRKLPTVAIGMLCLILIGLNTAAASHLGDEYFMSGMVWASIYGAILVTLFLLRPEKPGLALIASWAFVGIIAPYFPALFQRKLTMMLSVPWGILAGIGIAMILEKRERGQRNLLTTLGIIVFAATGVRWITREMTLAKKDVSSTTVHSIYYSTDVTSILDILRPLGANAVVAALPGVPSPTVDEAGNPVVDSYETPFIADLNPIFVGLAGNKAFAGHWSETPDYENKRKALGAMLSAETVSPNPLGITHLVLPKDHIPKHRQPEEFGEVLYRGNEFILIKTK